MSGTSTPNGSICCDTCMWSQMVGAPDGEVRLECHSSPPLVVGTPDDGRGWAMTVWPLVSPADWCGMFTPEARLELPDPPRRRLDAILRRVRSYL